MRAPLLVLSLTLGACASSHGTPGVYPGEAVAAAPPLRVAAPAPAPVIEDDGLPEQTAPIARAPERDDPSEPFSPNYGTGRHANLPARPHDLQTTIDGAGSGGART